MSTSAVPVTSSLTNVLASKYWLRSRSMDKVSRTPVIGEKAAATPSHIPDIAEADVFHLGSSSMFSSPWSTILDGSAGVSKSGCKSSSVCASAAAPATLCGARAICSRSRPPVTRSECPHEPLDSQSCCCKRESGWRRGRADERVPSRRLLLLCVCCLAATRALLVAWASLPCKDIIVATSRATAAVCCHNLAVCVQVMRRPVRVVSNSLTEFS